MDLSLGLIWLTLALSSGLALSSYLGLTAKWPKFFYVSALSNLSVLALYYTPGMYGYHYYFANILRVLPLIMWLVHLARTDPSPNWTYRALCLILIFQIITGGWHVLASLHSPYYDQLSLAATIMELMVIIIGGFNVRFSAMVRRSNHRHRAAPCSTWARRPHKS